MPLLHLQHNAPWTARNFHNLGGLNPVRKIQARIYNLHQLLRFQLPRNGKSNFKTTNQIALFQPQDFKTTNQIVPILSRDRETTNQIVPLLCCDLETPYQITAFSTCD